jgi:hypothetical protein
MSQASRIVLAVATTMCAREAMAEVADKVPPVPALWGLSVVLAILAVLLGLLRPWAALLPGIFALAGVMDLLGDIQNAQFREAVLAELGSVYFWHEAGAWVSAIVVSLLVFLIRVRRKKSSGIDA